MTPWLEPLPSGRPVVAREHPADIDAAIMATATKAARRLIIAGSYRLSENNGLRLSAGLGWLTLPNVLALTRGDHEITGILSCRCP